MFSWMLVKCGVSPRMNVRRSESSEHWTPLSIISSRSLKHRAKNSCIDSLLVIFIWIHSNCFVWSSTVVHLLLKVC